MNENHPPPSTPSPAGPTATPPTPPTPSTPLSKRRPWLLYGCGAFLALVLLIIATVAITIWYIQRPIKPVVLLPEEKALVEAKLERIGGKSPDAPATATPERGAQTAGRERRAPPVEPGVPPETRTITPIEPDRIYVPGSKVLRITERELNGLLNANTDLGDTLRFELGRDAINAYVAAPIPDDVPVLGGKMFRARGRFRISVSEGTTPYAVLEDVTVFGLSLPKAWLGGMKGENLLADAVGRRNGEPVLRGVKSLRIEPGALVLEVED
jgi:hypothetical protein